ncbi:hypothetical protein ES319_D12G088800v1 [Gossypium barbadense]|uniref:Uncharacterized protein n=3 Tax=Gossypium TaxID=3633 RepID=A0A5J5P058_GOSBA|nr:hypothetical protein ES319_D12G088800v1 [Gossypium barbadense]TYG40453.1 hypothetical protein ES288_D12G094100v1 [Gossypium darwinii]TYH38191.1 hypothetical protein ES332_D12G093600v1 [Gossypium tomentosum]
MDSLFAYWLDIIRKTLVFSKPLVHISHQMVLFDNRSNSSPTFIHEGTPNGLKTISTGLPSCK